MAAQSHEAESIYGIISRVGGVAQLGERRVRNAEVGSSILLLSTNRLSNEVRCVAGSITLPFGKVMLPNRHGNNMLPCIGGYVIQADAKSTIPKRLYFDLVILYWTGHNPPRHAHDTKALK